ncbi:MAG: sulfite exporter TauE/SafE family protein [Deltaproteobacteria bacterium]|nr:MAG: sulfite exporter TauE/SafE family protein [Deltaproteobacteria bacterium]
MSSTEALYLIYLSTGFTVGFGHCIGMCGPIVVSFTLNLRGRRVLIPHLLYNFGRIVTYTLIGGIMGATGSFTAVTANIAGLQKAVMVVAGLLIVIMGLAMSGWFPWGRSFGDRYKPDGIVSAGYRKLSSLKSTYVYFPLGLLLGLLPCGPVYTALIGAARAGMEVQTPLKGIFIGMGLMAAFGGGTVPALVLVAKLADLGWLKSKEIIYRISSVLMILVGVYFIVRAIRY